MASHEIIKIFDFVVESISKYVTALQQVWITQYFLYLLVLSFVVGVLVNARR